MPDPLRCSTDISAIVVPKGGNKSKGLEKELIDLCTSELEEYMIPTRIMFRDSVPLTVMGKVDRLKIIKEVDSMINELMKGGESPEEYR